MTADEGRTPAHDGLWLRETRRTVRVRPDAIQKFGYLSEVIQTKASIVLAHMFRQGVRIDPAGVRAFAERNKSRVEELTRELQHAYPDALAYGKDGQVQLTPKSRTPSLGRKRLATILQRVAEEIQDNGQPIQIPISQGKSKGLSQSAKSWQKFVPQHRFLQIWTEIENAGKIARVPRPAGCSNTALPIQPAHTDRSHSLLENRETQRSQDSTSSRCRNGPSIASCSSLGVPAISSSSRTTQRSSCGRWLPCAVRSSASRDWRMSWSKVWTPTPLPRRQSKTSPLSNTWPSSKPIPYVFGREGRQQRRSTSGFPGLGGECASCLRGSELRGRALRKGRRSAFRSKLISEIYPNLTDVNGYLADPAMANLARNLGVREGALWDTFDRSNKRSPLAARGVANVIAGVLRRASAISSGSGEDSSACSA